MRAARWAFGLLLISVAVLSGTHTLISASAGAADPTHPDRGDLAPLLDPPPGRVEVARVAPEFGRVIDLAVNGETLAVLTARGWVLRSGTATVDWMGSRTAGSPDWLPGPVSIAVGAGAVYVLDADRSVVSVWDTHGTRLSELAVPREGSRYQRLCQLVLTAAERPVVTLQEVQEDGTAAWKILEFDATGGPRAALSLPTRSPNMVFEAPILATAGSTLFLMAPLAHELSRVDLATSRVASLFTRQAPPLWVVPRRHRRSYRRMLNRLGTAAARLSQLPEFWPSVRDFTVTEGGAVLVAVSAGEDRQHIELLTRELKPIGRFSPEGFEEPVFLSRGRAFLVEEGMNGTVVYELIATPT
ncbi:MAG: hypothetical protein ACWGSQ_02100 [Longimicrobiales bacterium]